MPSQQFDLDPACPILVTGGAGFIGSNLVRLLLSETPATVINIDKLTYAGNLDSLSDVANHPRYRFYQADIADGQTMAEIFSTVRPKAVLHLAAESHVDRSITGAQPFVHTNITGTFTLLEAAREYRLDLSEPQRDNFRFLHVSTDEVFGSLGPEGRFTETTPYAPNSPYSASKAASDHLVRAWHATYGLPTILTNCSNNYGPYQFPEKLIPLMIHRALSGQALPVYGDGLNIRDWLYVTDHCRGILAALRYGVPGRSYNLGGEAEKTNLELVRTLCQLLDEHAPRPDGQPHASAIAFVSDRPGHDRRYAMDITRARQELGWTPQETLTSGLEKTVCWYLQNTAWCDRVMSGAYRGERLGLPETGVASR